MANFFFVREETDDRVVYHLRNAWVPYVVACVGVVGTGCWLLGRPPVNTVGEVVLWSALGLLLVRWLCFRKARAEMLSAKRSGRMTVAGSEFSRTDPPVITIHKVAGEE